MHKDLFNPIVIYNTFDDKQLEIITEHRSERKKPKKFGENMLSKQLHTSPNVRLPVSQEGRK